MQAHVRLAFVTCVMATITAAVPAVAQVEPGAVTAQPDGTVLLGTRSIPLADTLSPEAIASLAHNDWPSLPFESMRDFMRELGKTRAAQWKERFGVTVEAGRVGAVQINVVTPKAMPRAHRNRVLLHIHGGGFSLCDRECSYTEAIPLAALSETRVVSVDYSLAPEKQFPIAVDEVVQVYRSLLKDHAPARIGMFGSSAGAIIAAQVTAKLKKSGLPLPGALEFLSGSADLARNGDSFSLFGTGGFRDLTREAAGDGAFKRYLGETDPRDPVVSPMYSDLHGFPPTLLMTSTRDLFLSATANFERALYGAGVHTELAVYDGLNHTFWLSADIPEAMDALRRQAAFFERHLGR